MKRIFLLNMGLAGLLLASMSIVAVEKEQKMSQQAKEQRPKKAKKGRTRVPPCDKLGNLAVFSHDGALLVTATTKNGIAVFDFCTLKHLCTLTGHKEDVRSIAISRDGSHIASASKDETVKIWNVRKKACVKTLALESNSVTFNYDGSKIIAGNNLCVEEFDINTGERLRTLANLPGWVMAIALSPNNLSLVSVASSQTGRIVTDWDMRNGRWQKEVQTNSDRIDLVTFSHHDSCYAYVDGTTVSLCRYGSLMHQLKDHTGKVNAIAFNSDDSCMVTASDDKTLKVWDVASGSCLDTLHGHENPVLAVIFSRDNEHVLSVSRDKVIKVWYIADLVQQAKKGDESRGCHENGLPKASGPRVEPIASPVPVHNPLSTEQNMPQRSSWLSWLTSYRAAIVTSGLLAVTGCALLYTYFWSRHTC